MSGENKVAQALGSLTLAEVWELADVFGQGVPVPTRDGVVKSPFRDDGKTGSFSVSRGLTRWKDFGGGEQAGGFVWQFIQKCRPEWEKREICRYVVERAGLSWEDGRARELSVVEQRERRLAAQRREKQAREKAYRDYRRAQGFPASRRVDRCWLPAVGQRWHEAMGHLLNDRALCTRLAKSRGWPLEWVEELATAGKLGAVLLPWARPAHRVKRGIGFLIEGPVGKREDCAGREAMAAEMAGTDAQGTLLRDGRVPVGMHVRYVVAVGPEDGASGTGEQRWEKRWTYVPSAGVLEKYDRRLTDFERSVKAGLEAAGVRPGDEVCPALPFVLGNVTEPEVVIVAEGQWDAATFWGALGGYDFEHWDERLSGIGCFGIRGVSGADVFLAYYGGLLRRLKPRVLILADNDEAGRKWDTDRRAVGKLPEPSFKARLLKAGLEAVTVARMKPEPLGDGSGKTVKDFNDYWKLHRPTAAALWGWMESAVGVG